MRSPFVGSSTQVTRASRILSGFFVITGLSIGSMLYLGFTPMKQAISDIGWFLTQVYDAGHTSSRENSLTKPKDIGADVGDLKTTSSSSTNPATQPSSSNTNSTTAYPTSSVPAYSGLSYEERVKQMQDDQQNWIQLMNEQSQSEYENSLKAQDAWSDAKAAENAAWLEQKRQEAEDAQAAFRAEHGIE